MSAVSGSIRRSSLHASIGVLQPASAWGRIDGSRWRAASSYDFQRGGNPLDGTLENEIQDSLVDGKLPCAVAFKIARKLKVTPKQVGDAANRLNIKITSCQLGCFP
jgi:hypothetical protein